MIDSPTESLLRLEKVCTVGMSVPAVGRSLFLSLNPDLVDDFGHFLNYEKRIRGLCAEVGMAYRCLANRRLSITDPELLPTFEQDSGHFALVRRDAAGREAAIAGQLADVIRDSIREMERGGAFDNIFVFLYCGSSVLASRLAEFGWEPRIRICVNAFWDFLLADTHYRHLAVMPFQRQVRLLAMSDLHRDEMLDASGLSFSSIPNPPPLLSDTQSYDAIHAQAGKVWRRGSVQVLIPGLMTLGKGGDATRSLLERVRVGDGSPSRFVFRDRKCVLGADAPPSLSIITGDLTDDDVAELYRASDFAVLPYEPITFGVRTSGALVDCLVFGVVPLVMQGTWLAHVCREFDFGCVLPNMEPDTVLRTLRQSSVDLPAERARVIQAAGRYLAQHHWRRLFELVTHTSDGGPPAPEQGAPLREASPLAVANRLYRDGRFNEAARVYAWLKQGSPLPIYERNLRMCESHVSQ